MKKIFLLFLLLTIKTGYSQSNVFEVDTDLLNIKLDFNYSFNDCTLRNISFKLENKMDTIFVSNNDNYDLEYGNNSLYLYYPSNTNSGGFGGEKVKLSLIKPKQIISFTISINEKFDESFNFFFFYSFIRAESIKDTSKNNIYPEEISNALFDQLFEYSQFKMRISLRNE